MYGEPPRVEIRREIEAEVLQAIHKGECFCLRSLTDTFHETGWILSEFRELVVIDRERVDLLLVVMAVD